MNIFGIIGLISDAVTTIYGFYFTSYSEKNVVVDTLWNIHSLMGLQYVITFYCVLALILLYYSGWISIFLSSYTGIVMGFGGINNLILFITGFSVIGYISSLLSIETSIVAMTIIPIIGFVLSTIITVIWYYY